MAGSGPDIAGAVADHQCTRRIEAVRRDHMRDEVPLVVQLASKIRAVNAVEILGQVEMVEYPSGKGFGLGSADQKPGRKRPHFSERSHDTVIHAGIKQAASPVVAAVCRDGGFGVASRPEDFRKRLAQWWTDDPGQTVGRRCLDTHRSHGMKNGRDDSGSWIGQCAVKIDKERVHGAPLPRTRIAHQRLDAPPALPHEAAMSRPDPLVDPPPPRRGLMFVLASPSGTGKTSMARQILAADPVISMSVSATTREARPGEIDGKDYHFVDEAEFDRLVEVGLLLEWAHVFGHRYGTPREPVRDALAAGHDVLFDIDWQGTQQLKARDAKDVVSVFLLPPSLGELERRLVARGTDSADIIKGRMDRAASEISHWGEFDYVLVNDDFEACLREVRAILQAERQRRSRRKATLAATVRDMLGEAH